MQDRSKHFVLPYEPDYTAHRTDDHARRVTELHMKAREPVAAPPLVPELAEPDEAHMPPGKARAHSHR